MNRAVRLAAVAATALVAAAHVGSPDTYFQGAAGPYPIRVIVRSPGVVPGQAEIIVRLLAPGAVSRVSVLPIFWDPRTAAPPPSDRAERVAGDPTLFRAALWLMRSGAYGVQVTIDGDRGRGTALVPVQAVATRRLGLSVPLALLLGALGALLVAGAVTLVGAAARESALPAGQAPDGRRIRRARAAMVVSVLVFALALASARAWWQAVDTAFRSGVYHPRAARATVLDSGNSRTLRVTFADSADDASSWAPLVPDHGHLLHLFLVRDSTLATFAHLHPVAVDSVTFDAQLPPLEPGPYRLYGDIVHETGFAETLTGCVNIPPPHGRWHPSDPDDAWISSPGADTASWARLADGSILTWAHAGLLVNADAPLRFTLQGPDHEPVVLEPYMGMAGHLMLTRGDGAVFVHLHPAGTISVGAQQTFLRRERGDTITGALAHRLAAAPEPPMAPEFGSEVSCPYAFPQPGHYRLWVQIKRSGRILTGVFDADVMPAGS